MLSAAADAVAVAAGHQAGDANRLGQLAVDREPADHLRRRVELGG
jgi:hypothetical protein